MLAIDVETHIGALELKAKLPASKGTTVIIGPNGAGKSTFLKSILGEVKPRSGRITLGGRSLFCTGSNTNIPMEERCLGYVPQKYALFPHMTVFQNVAFGLQCSRWGSKSRQKRKDRVMELLEDLRIDHLALRKTPSLSGGEAQRVALARAMATGPEALLLDEPMAALDSGARRKVRKFLAVRLRAAGIPTIVVSHDIDDAEVLGDRVAVLEAGKIVQVGTLKALRANPATPFVKQFLDTSPAEAAGVVNEIEAI